MLPKVKKVFEWKKHAMGVYCLSRGRLNSTIFSGAGDKFIAEWNLEDFSPENFSVKMEQAIYAVQYIPELNILAAGSATGNLHIIDLNKKEEVKNIALHQNGIFDLIYISNGNFLVSFGGDGLMAVWDCKTWKLKLQFPISDDKLRRGAYSASHQMLAVPGGDGRIRIFETAFFNELANFKAHNDGVNSLAFHPTRPILLSGGKDAHLNFWNLEDDFKQLYSIPAHNFAIYSIVFSPDGKWCATGSRDKTVKVWDATTFDQPLRVDIKSHRAHTHSVNDLYWSDYKNYLISAGDDRAIMVWEVL